MSQELYQQVDPEDVGMSSAYLRNIDALQERYLAENAYQGSVILVARHGKVCYFTAFGKADEGVPMATDSIFRLASMSKVVAAVAVMQLWEQGRIALHEPISTYLPEFADMKVAVVKDWQVTQLMTAEREITPHDLLSMTAQSASSGMAKDGACEADLDPRQDQRGQPVLGQFGRSIVHLVGAPPGVNNVRAHQHVDECARRRLVDVA